MLKEGNGVISKSPPPPSLSFFKNLTTGLFCICLLDFILSRSNSARAEISAI
jgi:hypothetical protein